MKLIRIVGYEDVLLKLFVCVTKVGWEHDDIERLWKQHLGEGSKISSLMKSIPQCAINVKDNTLQRWRTSSITLTRI